MSIPAKRLTIGLFAALALALAACQGGLDSGMGGMGGYGGGEMGPPVQNPGDLGSMNSSGTGGMPGMPGGGLMGPRIGATPPGYMAGPTMAPNGMASLMRPGAPVPPNDAQYPVAQGPSGMNCPRLTGSLDQFSCSISFNVPPPSPAPSPAGSAKPAATGSPSPAAKPGAESAADSPTPSPTPTPPGTLTLQVEPLPQDVPPMTHPDPRALRTNPLVALRMQTDTPVALHDSAIARFTLPRTAFGDGSFALQLYNEGFYQGRKIDQFLSSYSTFTSSDGQNVTFQFEMPKVTVRPNQVWLLALYGIQYPPGTTPTPSPSPSASASASPSAASSPTPSVKPAASP
jgi:hypothetical protein